MKPPLRAGGIAAIALAALLAWEATGLDLALARLAGGVAGFPLRDAYLLDVVLHRDMRNLAWLLWLVLAWGAFRPFAFLRSLRRYRRVQLPVAVLICLLGITAIKAWSRTSCPWDLALFGGTLPYVPHWRPGVADGGGGHCFPAGHASTGFAFVAGYFALRDQRPRLAAWWLAGALAAGLVLGASQQLRGAHFTSHTLWTAWLCWLLGGMVDAAFSRWPFALRKPSS